MCAEKRLSKVQLSLIKVYFSSLLDTSDLGQSQHSAGNFSQYNEEQGQDVSTHLFPHDAVVRSHFSDIQRAKGVSHANREHTLIWIHAVVGMTGTAYLNARTSWDCQCVPRGVKNYISVIVSP